MPRTSAPPRSIHERNALRILFSSQLMSGPRGVNRSASDGTSVRGFSSTFHHRQAHSRLLLINDKTATQIARGEAESGGIKHLAPSSSCLWLPPRRDESQAAGAIRVPARPHFFGSVPSSAC